MRGAQLAGSAHAHRSSARTRVRCESVGARLCDVRLAGRYDLRVTDVLEDAAAAEAANIIATPALMRRAPLPVRMVVGDLSRREALVRGLGLEEEDDRDGEQNDE